MTFAHATRCCATPDVIRLLERDGLGWDHDLQCGAFTLTPHPETKEAK